MSYRRDFNVSSSQSEFSVGENAFANTENLEHCVKYLNHTLVTFGFPASLDFFATDPVSVARTCNCVYSLLQQRQKDIEFRDSYNDQRQRSRSDVSILESKVERLESQLLAKDREIATMARTEAKATANFKAQIDKLQKERDEFQKMVIGNQQVRTQLLYEMKKKEKDYVKLQEKLNQVLMEKKKESKSGMEIMNLLQKEGRQRGTWNGKKTDSDFSKMIVNAYELKKQELMAENNDLRASLRSLQVDPDLDLPDYPTSRGADKEWLSPCLGMDMRVFLNASDGLPQQNPACSIRKEEMSPQAAATPTGGRTDVFDLPFRMARDQIEESLRTKMSSIKSRMVQLQDAQKGADVTSEASERELELEAQLVEARSIIEEQASMMSKHLAKTENPKNESSI